MPITNEQFLKAYADLPLGVRKQIIMVIDDKPITWNVAYSEVSGNTERSKQILTNLEKLRILKGD